MRRYVVAVIIAATALFGAPPIDAQTSDTAGQRADHTAGWANGRFWTMMGDDVQAKYAYIVGVTDAVSIVSPVYATKLTCKCTYEEWVKGIDGLYERDPTYMALPVLIVMELYTIKTRGQSAEAVDVVARHWLQNLSGGVGPIVPVPLIELPKPPKMK